MNNDPGGAILVVTALAVIAFIGLLSIRGACEAIRRAWRSARRAHRTSSARPSQYGSPT